MLPGGRSLLIRSPNRLADVTASFDFSYWSALIWSAIECCSPDTPSVVTFRGAVAFTETSISAMPRFDIVPGNVAIGRRRPNHICRSGILPARIRPDVTWAGAYMDDETSRYERQRGQLADRDRVSSETVRDIGLPPKLAPELMASRAECDASLRVFLETCFPNAFKLAWSQDHLDVIEAIQHSIDHGGLVALAMPRGSGKTTISIRAAIWAVLTARVPFVVLIGATAPKAETVLLKSVKTELERNTILHSLYPVELHGFPQLQGNSGRCAGQLCDGVRTGIEWTSARLVFPLVPGSRISGHVLCATGLTGGEIRGQQHTLPDGSIIRPSFVILDDPQTKKTAASVTMTDERELIIEQDVMGLAGPDKDVTAVMPCTIIEHGDLADRYLDSEQHPEWDKQLKKLLYALPERMDLWEEYGALLKESHRTLKNISLATDYYRANLDMMNLGADVAWPHRFRPTKGEISGLQFAMNVKLTNEATFASEYQNSPLTNDMHDTLAVDPITILQKCNRVKRGTVPEGHSKLAAFVDVGDYLLWWCVVSADADFNSHIVDYGVYPEQPEVYFRKTKARQTLARKHAAAGRTGSIQLGLDALTDRLATNAYYTEDGAELFIGKLLIDSGHETTLIKAHCRRSSHKARVSPSQGTGIGPAQIPISEYAKVRGIIGAEWYRPKNNKQIVLFDANFWKTTVHKQLRATANAGNAMTLFGSAASHRLFADHLTAESATLTSGRGRDVWVWRQTTGLDNDWLDCVTGCLVCLSVQGVLLPGETGESGPKRKRSGRKWSDLRNKKQ